MVKLNKSIKREFKGRMTSRRYVVEISGGDGKTPILSMRELGRHKNFRIDLEVLYLRLAGLRG